MSLVHREELVSGLFTINTREDFDAYALRIFNWQAASNPLYKNYLDLIHVAPESVKSVEKIPFLPISFFKSHDVKTGQFEAQAIFTSSGTGQSGFSCHHVRDMNVYHESFVRSFRLFLGDPSSYHVFALLPSYLERQGSSLVTMMESLIAMSGNTPSGFYLDQWDQLTEALRWTESQGKKSILLGVTFGLLDFSEHTSLPLRHTSIIETGGMKGRRRELIREEVHQILGSRFGLKSIGSEYGMTELLSQAWSASNGVFFSPPWMRVFIRQTSDPLAPALTNGRGALNIIDLANIDSCSFIATQDLGIVHPDGSFEVQGRMDHADVRGCNLMVA